MVIIIIIILIFCAILWYNHTEKKKEEREQKERMAREQKQKYYEKILNYLNNPSINIFKVNEKQADDDPYSIELIKRFSDYALLSDFNGTNLLNKEKSYNNERSILIPKQLRSKLEQFNTFLEEKFFEEIKTRFLGGGKYGVQHEYN